MKYEEGNTLDTSEGGNGGNGRTGGAGGLHAVDQKAAGGEEDPEGHLTRPRAQRGVGMGGCLLLI